MMTWSLVGDKNQAKWGALEFLVSPDLAFQAGRESFVDMILHAKMLSVLLSFLQRMQ